MGSLPSALSSLDFVGSAADPWRDADGQRSTESEDDSDEPSQPPPPPPAAGDARKAEKRRREEEMLAEDEWLWGERAWGWVEPEEEPPAQRLTPNRGRLVVRRQHLRSSFLWGEGFS